MPTFHVVQWIRDLDARRLLAANGLEEDARLSLPVERARLARAQTETAELRNAVMRRELIPVSEIARPL